MIRRSLCACAVAALAAPPAAAFDFSINAGATLTSDYLVNGITQTRGNPAFQPYVEIESAGFYAGIWASNVRFAGVRDRAEIDLYAGYRGEVGLLGFDIGYARYFYDRSGDDSGEFLLGFAVETDHAMAFGANLGYNHTYSTTTASVTAGFTFDELFTLSAEAGREGGSHNFWNAGLGIQVNDSLSLDLRAHDTSIRRARFTVGASVDFALR